MLKKILSYSRIAIPLMLGVCIGIGLSFMILPLFEESACELHLQSPGIVSGHYDQLHLYKTKRSNQLHPFLEGLDLDSFRSAEFEPRVITTEQSEAQTAQKPARKRFIQSELSMKEWLFVAYITSPDQFGGRVTALNKTLTSANERIGFKFFVNKRMVSSSATDIPVMAFNLLEPLKLPLLTIKYLMNQFHDVKLYKYYLILPDTSYPNVNLLIHGLMKRKTDHFVGFSRQESEETRGTCDLSAGFVLSEVSR